MSRRMSCGMTIEAVRERRKTVTRRHVDTWRTLAPGEPLTLVEKAQGLRKGERQIVLAEVEVVSVRVQPLDLLFVPWDDAPSRYGIADMAREGLPDMSPAEFVVWWAHGHGHGRLSVAEARRVEARRIEWRYLDEAAS